MPLLKKQKERTSPGQAKSNLISFLKSLKFPCKCRREKKYQCQSVGRPILSEGSVAQYMAKWAPVICKDVLNYSRENN